MVKIFNIFVVIVFLLSMNSIYCFNLKHDGLSTTFSQTETGEGQTFDMPLEKLEVNQNQKEKYFQAMIESQKQIKAEIEAEDSTSFLDLKSKTTANSKIQSKTSTTTNYFHKNTRSTYAVPFSENIGQHYIYSTSMSIGTPPQKLRVVVDTGSSNILIASILCKRNKQCKNVKRFYDHTKSKTHKKSKGHLNIQYVTVSLKGPLVTDNFLIGKSLKVKNQQFAEVSHLPKNFFTDSKIHGVVGLNFNVRPHDAPGGTSLFDNLRKQKLLKRNIIGFQTIGQTESGVMNFGYINHKAYHGKLNIHKVHSDYRWLNKLTSLTLKYKEKKKKEKGPNLVKGKAKKDKKKEEVKLYLRKDATVMVDSGAPGMTMPSGTLKDLMKKIKLKKDCSNYDTLPDLIYKIDQIEYRVPVKEYTFNFHGKTCGISIAASNFSNAYILVLGEAFMSHYYVAFDVDNKTVSIGASRTDGLKKDDLYKD